MNPKPQYEIFHGTSEDSAKFEAGLNAFTGRSDVHLLEKPSVTVHFRTETGVWYYMALVVYSDVSPRLTTILKPNIIGVH